MADAFLLRPADEAEAYSKEMFRGPSSADFAQSLAAQRYLRYLYFSPLGFVFVLV